MYLLQVLYFIPIIAALVLCLRNRSLSQYMPLLIAGFAANLVSLTLNSGIIFWIRYLMEQQSQNINSTLGNSYYTLTSLLSLGSWALIACGLGFVLNDVRQKLQCLDTMTQSGWNYTPDHQQNSQAYSQNPFSQNSSQQHREENHVFPFASASAPLAPPAASPPSAPVVGMPAPDVSVCAPEPDVMLPLGSSHS